MAALCSICRDEVVADQWHLHRGQVWVQSSSWTGRETRRFRYWTRALWAKVYVWARFHIKNRWCKSIGGHDICPMNQRCGFCGLSREELSDLTGWNILKWRPQMVAL